MKIEFDLDNELHRKILYAISNEQALKVFLYLSSGYHTIQDVSRELNIDYAKAFYYVKKFAEIGIVKQSMGSIFKDLRFKHLKIEVPMFSEEFSINWRLAFLVVSLIFFLVSKTEFLKGFSLSFLLIASFLIVQYFVSYFRYIRLRNSG